MRWLAALLAFASIASLSLPSSLAATTNPSDAPVDPATESTLELVRWDVVLNDAGADAIRALENQPVESNCKVYESFLFDSATLRGAIAQAGQTGGVEIGGQNMSFSRRFGAQMMMTQGFYLSTSQSGDYPVVLQLNSGGAETVRDMGGDSLSIQLDATNINVNLHEVVDHRWTRIEAEAPTISFDVKLPFGKSLVLIGAYGGSAGTHNHVIVYEPFKAPRWQDECRRQIGDSLWWAANGPDGAVAMIDTAADWAASGDHDVQDVPPGFAQTTSNGETLKLTGLTQADKYPFCWWDGLGKPIDHPQYVQFQSSKDLPLQGAVQIHISSDGAKLFTPLGKSKFASVGYGDRTQVFSAVNGQIDVGIPVGPWQQVGEIRPGGSVTVDGQRYRLQGVQSMGNSGVFVDFFPSGRSQDLLSIVTLTAILNDGSEVDADYVPQLMGRNYGFGAPQFQAIKKSDVKSFHVWQRKLQWLTFNKLPDHPVTEPRTNLTPDQIAAAQAYWTEHHRIGDDGMDPEVGRIVIARRRWQSTPIDPKTPLGALRQLVDGVNKGDVAAVRARITAQGPDSDALLDLWVQRVVARAATRAKLLQHFTPMAFEGNALMTNLEDMESILIRLPWRADSDGSLKCMGFSVVKSAAGDYKLDLTTPLKAPNLKQALAEQIGRLARINDLLTQNPKTSFHDLKAELENAATQPAK